MYPSVNGQRHDQRGQLHVDCRSHIGRPALPAGLRVSPCRQFVLAGMAL